MRIRFIYIAMILSMANCLVMAKLQCTAQPNGLNGQQQGSAPKTNLPKPSPSSRIPAVKTTTPRAQPAAAEPASSSTKATTSSSTALTHVDVTALGATEAEIKKELPMIKESTLGCDRAVVSETLPSIKASFAEHGLKEADALEAVSDGWMAVRLESRLSSDKCMVQSSFQKYVGDLGKMVFRTVPDAALIEVSGKSLNKRTSYKKWYEPKTYQVKYTREGYMPVEKPCTVVKSTITDCFAELPPNR